MVMSAELERKGTAETTYKNNFHARSLGQKKRWSEMKKLKLAQMEENKRQQKEAELNGENKLKSRI